MIKKSKIENYFHDKKAYHKRLFSQELKKLQKMWKKVLTNRAYGGILTKLSARATAALPSQYDMKERVPCKLNNEQNEQAPDVRTF